MKKTTAFLSFSDRLGSLMVRCGLNRMDYTVKPGLYALGNPDARSHVLVTANYKLSFDTLRRELAGLNIWILVLDTKGINVWCAAGKGTFGTDELVRRINASGLRDFISHRTLILPQLGAPGVAAHEVSKKSGFKIVYGPVQAKNIKAFIDAGLAAKPQMRQVDFTICDRMVLTPIEVIGAFRKAPSVFGAMFLLNAFNLGSFRRTDFYAFSSAILAGNILVPACLPWIPFRAFAAKGALMGLVASIGFNAANNRKGNNGYGLLTSLAYLFIITALSSYYGLNFTGSSTYTSLSGVTKETKRSLPLIIASLIIGSIMLLISSFLQKGKGIENAS